MTGPTQFLVEFSHSTGLSLAEAKSLVEKYATVAKYDCPWFCAGHNLPSCKQVTTSPDITPPRTVGISQAEYPTLGL